MILWNAIRVLLPLPICSLQTNFSQTAPTDVAGPGAKGHSLAPRSCLNLKGDKLCILSFAQTFIH